MWRPCNVGMSHRTPFMRTIVDVDPQLGHQAELPVIPKRRISLCLVSAVICWIGLVALISTIGFMCGRHLIVERHNIQADIRDTPVGTNTPCLLRVFSNNCDVSSLQLHVSLGLLLSQIVREDDISVSETNSEFRVQISPCSTELATILTSVYGTDAWKAKLAPIVECGLFVSVERPSMSHRSRSVQAIKNS